MLFHFIYQHATGTLRGAYSFGTVEAPLMQCSEIHRAANRTTRRGTGYYCTVTVVYRSRSEEHCCLPLRYCNCKRTQLKRTVIRAMSCDCKSTRPAPFYGLHRVGKFELLGWCPPCDTSDCNAVQRVKQRLQREKVFTVLNYYHWKIKVCISSKLQIEFEGSRSDFPPKCGKCKKTVPATIPALYTKDKFSLVLGIQERFLLQTMLVQ